MSDVCELSFLPHDRFLAIADAELVEVSESGYWSGNQAMRDSQSYTATFGHADSCPHVAVLKFATLYFYTVQLKEKISRGCVVMGCENNNEALQLFCVRSVILAPKGST